MAAKKCPFCRKEIIQGTEKCPHCNRVLIERVSESSASHANQSHAPQNKKADLKKNLKSFLERFKRNNPKKVYYAYQYDKWKRIKRTFLISTGIVVFVGLSIVIQISNSRNAEKSKRSPTQTSDQPAIDRPIISLDNGTIINSLAGYFGGLGKLSIDNGTDSDSVAKLINGSKKSVITVYIKAHNNYTIDGIAVGRYELFFAHGRDWNSSTNSFLLNRSFSKFEEGFDFTVHDEYRSDGTYQVYSTYSVTLHPVAGGAAKTDPVSEGEFSNL